MSQQVPQPLYQPRSVPLQHLRVLRSQLLLVSRPLQPLALPLSQLLPPYPPPVLQLLSLRPPLRLAPLNRPLPAFPALPPRHLYQPLLPCPRPPALLPPASRPQQVYLVLALQPPSPPRPQFLPAALALQLQ